MRCAVLKSQGNLIIEDRPLPACPEGGLLIRTTAASICSVDARMLKHHQPALVYPRVLGHEIAGVVFQSRAAGKPFKEGDRVQVYPGVFCGKCPACLSGQENRCTGLQIMGFSYDGAFADYLTVPAAGVRGGGVNLIPAGLSSERAAMAEPLASCLNAFDQVGWRSGESLLVLGAGPLGLLNCWLASSRGAAALYLAESRPDRLAAAAGLTSAALIDVSCHSLSEYIHESSGGRGVDVIIAACSSYSAAQLVPLLNRGGRLCCFSGLPSDSASGCLDFNQLHYRELSLTGAYGSTPVQHRQALDLIASGKIPVERLITSRLSLSEINRGLEIVAACRVLKVIINF
jgi:L-iditol 2-dehydrogenase